MGEISEEVFLCKRNSVCRCYGCAYKNVPIVLFRNEGTSLIWLFMVSYKISFWFYRGVWRCYKPKSSNQKLKLIYLMKILLERTDETHSITMPEIIDALAAYDISAECKTGKNREPSMLSTVPDVLPTNFEICSLLGLIYCLRLMRV